MTVRVILGRIVGRSRRRNPRPEELGAVTAEFAVAQWLTHAVEYGDAQMIAHGEQMLQAVCENLRDSGDMLGQNQPLPERAEGLE